MVGSSVTSMTDISADRVALMVDDRRNSFNILGSLTIEGQGGYPAKDMRRLLTALEESYQAAARVELAAQRVLAGVEWLARYGPPPRYFLPIGAFIPSTSDAAEPAERLIVSRVVLESPGFWEFVGNLNPLEVVRKYLNDRHERAKDRDYRSPAERDRLALDNAMRRLDVIERIAKLEGEYGPDLYVSEAWHRGWAAELRPSFDELGELDDRGLIAGDTATTSRELPSGEPRPDEG